ncbi:hypothetical protein GQ44DRAFT_735452 [Phaeosphaeriaceae sp. PMI808]|nr:hypothetical protein GQ44DRAFT_735452 [Phaeosphaeriaceae sp. PMI808]
MEEQEVTQDLSSLENDADEFDRLMIQNARDERRLKDALHGSARVQAFRKARTHPRVGLTIDNLERNNARNDGAQGANAQVTFKTSPSSSRSTRSDPAIHAPAAWGRKSRSNRNWMRSITHDESPQTPRPAANRANALYNDQYQQHTGEDANVPRQSIEDSPLSHKGTPRNDQSEGWDLTFEINEASIIASTPYIPRNTMLDDIWRREVENLKPDEISEVILEQNKGPNAAEQSTPESPSSGKRLRNRTNSWKSIGKSQPVTGTGRENSPVTVYKTSTEAISTEERDALSATQRGPSRPMRHRREDSQDLLRRLARASNTPSPGRVEAPRPHTAPARQPMGSTVARDSPMEDDNIPKSTVEFEAVTETHPQQDEPKQTKEEPEVPPEPVPEREAEDVDATPMPIKRPVLEAKTPIVTGAWVDTPGPRTIRKHVNITASTSQSPTKSSMRKNRSPEKPKAPIADEDFDDISVKTVRPQLPSSVLQALVQEAKAHDRRQSVDYGDSTINSLEDLIAPSHEGEAEEDTLQGLQIPTTAPRNEAERQRQDELLHLHRMSDRLRAARTSIRDASRGMRRVEGRVEHREGAESEGKITYRECPCAAEGGHLTSFWTRSTSVIWDAGLKAKRKGTKWRMLGGLTALSIFVIAFLVWWISEEIACDLYCHQSFANYSPYPYSVNPDAPQFPFVIPTLVYRSLAGWIPLSSVAGWIGSTSISKNDFAPGASSTAAWAGREQLAEEIVWDQSMLHDEVIR